MLNNTPREKKSKFYRRICNLLTPTLGLTYREIFDALQVTQKRSLDLVEELEQLEIKGTIRQEIYANGLPTKWFLN